MALMIETKNIGIARADTFELKFGVIFPERRERVGETLRRSRQLQNDLLRGMRMSMERIARNGHSFLRRRRHYCGIIMAGHALRARDQAQIIQATMFLMAS